MSILDILNDPRQLNAVGTALQAGGDFMGAYSHIQYGQQAAQASNFQAEQLRQQAGQAQAASQRDAYSVQREADYTASHALAVAAASGGGASDPTVIDLIARNAGEFAYRKSVALYQGNDRARLLNMQADAKEYEGKIIERNANQVATAQGIKGATSLLAGYERDASLAKKYGGGGPMTMSNPSAFSNGSY